MFCVIRRNSLKKWEFSSPIWKIVLISEGWIPHFFKTIPSKFTEHFGKKLHQSPLRIKTRRKKATPPNGLMLVYNRTQRYWYGVTVGKPENGGWRKIHSHSLPASTTNQYSLWQIWLWFHRPPLFRCVCISFHLILILFFFFCSFVCCCCCSGDGVCYHTIFSIQTAEHSLYIVRRARKLNVNAVLLLRLLLLV